MAEETEPDDAGKLRKLWSERQFRRQLREAVWRVVTAAALLVGIVSAVLGWLGS